jgi:hypothetical protein
LALRSRRRPSRPKGASAKRRRVEAGHEVGAPVLAAYREFNTLIGNHTYSQADRGPDA